MTQLLWTPTPEPLRARVWGQAGLTEHIVLGWMAVDMLLVMTDLGRPTMTHALGELAFVGPPDSTPDEMSVVWARNTFEARARQ